MKKQITITTCDLCGHESDPQRPNTARAMYTLEFSSTDQAGHDEEWEKHICIECRNKVKAI